ncbi:MAG: DUF362 domain-containing protein [Firmicutes bacterium]|nr:DUF362 domain-containing protein [Bacillota bacterium]
MAKVAVMRCPKYQTNQIYSRITEALWLLDYRLPDLTGKIALVKPNILAAAPPEAAVCTHPAVVEAVIRLLQERGAQVWVGDSPAFDTLAKAARRSGIAEVVEKTRARLVDFSKATEVAVTPGLIVKKLQIAAPLTQVDFTVNVAKLKTHGLTRYTGAVKNLFGVIPGKRKAQFHMRMSQLKDFATLLLDIYAAVKPDLSIIDGIIGMEGAGPRNGNPRKMEALLLSTNGHYLDAAACALIGLKPEGVSTLREAMAYGLLDPAKLKILGEDPAGYGLAGKVKLPPDSRGTSVNLPGFILDRLQNLLTAKPVLIPELCIGCGICVESCPPKTIEIIGKKASFNYTNCIRCYCCQELCPQGAIELKTSWLSRLLESR